MTLSISVSGDALLGYQIVVPSTTGGVFLLVTRVDLAGHYPDTAVRGLDMISVAGSAVAVTDYEAPFNCEIKYTAKLFTLTNLTTSAASADSNSIDTVLPYGFTIITNALVPADRCAGTVTELNTWKRAARVKARHDVLMRANPVIVSDVTSGREGSFLVHTLNTFIGIDWDGTGPYDYGLSVLTGWETIFATGQTYLFRNSQKYSGFDDCYFKLSSNVNSKRVSKLGQLIPPMMEYSIDWTEVDKPATSIIGLGLMTWQDVLDNNSTWQTVLTKHATWLDVLNNPSL